MEPAELSVGAVLATAREARGLSIEDIAAATRIRAQLIGEIEHDDYTNCGGAIYARGHIKAIAHEVGADADELVARFDREHGGAPVPKLEVATLPKLTMPGDREVARAKRTSPHWASAAVAVLAVAALFFGVTWFMGRDHSTPQRTADAPLSTALTTSAAPSPTTAAPTTTTAPTTTPPRTTPPAPSGVSVRAQVTDGASWIQVKSSAGQEIFAQVVSAGQVKEWRDPQGLTVRFGNAPVVHLVVDGRDVGLPCADRTVCTVQFPANGADVR